MSIFSNIPLPEDAVGAGRSKAISLISDSGLFLKGAGLSLRKGGQYLRAARGFSAVGTEPREELSFNVQRDFMWDAILPDIKDSHGQVLKGLSVSRFCQSLRMKYAKLSEVVSVKYGSESRSYPGNVDFENLSASFITSVPAIVSHYFQSWFNLEVKDGVYFPKYNQADFSLGYAKTIEVVLFDRLSKPTEWVILHGVFPIELTEHELTYDGDNYLKYDVVFNVDKITEKPRKENK